MKIFLIIFALFPIPSLSYAQSASAQIELRGTVPSQCDNDICNDPNIKIYIDENGKKVYEIK